MANEGRSFSFQTGHTNSFSIVDYVLFAATLVISTLIGFYYAFKDRNNASTREFLLAGGKMHVFPVSMSLLASFMSAITLLGTPAEMYNYGTMYWWIGLSYAGAVGLAAHVYVPVFYNLKVTSAYEYLEKRFSKGVRLLGTCIFCTQMMVYMSIVLYGPSLALNAVTGFSLWGAVVSVGILCTVYTAVGGMKAVLWTDTFQAMMMVAGLMATLIQGSIELGGFSKAWEIAANNERVYFDDFRLDPSVRHSAWALVVGGIFLWVSVYGTNQAQVQRTLTCGNLRDAQIALWLNFPGLCVILFLSCLVGIVMYAFYSSCDPIAFKLVMASDQQQFWKWMYGYIFASSGWFVAYECLLYSDIGILYPLFVMDVLSHVPGVPGLFVACIFSGTLSTISSGLNSLATVTLQDFVKPYISSSMSERRATNFTKIMALVFGLICLGLTYVASLLGGILQAALSLFGMLGAPMLGLFTLGMIFPWANYKGAYAGLISSLVIMLWIGVGTYIYKPKNWQASISVAGCNWNLTTLATPVTMNATFENVTSTMSGVFDRVTSAVPSVMDNATGAIDTAAESHSDPFYPLYTLSYMWYSLTAVLIVVVVGMAVSLITGRQDPKTIDARLICPIFDALFPYLPEKILKPLRFGVNHKSTYDISEAKTEELPTARKRKSEKIFIARVDTFDLELQVNGKLLSDETEETNEKE